MARFVGRQRAWGLLVCTSVILWSHGLWAYSFAGGTGEPNNPYRIAKAKQLISIGSDPICLISTSCSRGIST